MIQYVRETYKSESRLFDFMLDTASEAKSRSLQLRVQAGAAAPPSYPIDLLLPQPVNWMTDSLTSSQP